MASDGLLGLGALLLIAALVFTAMRDRFRVSGFLSADQCWLTLKGVHPAFVAASNAAQQAALAQQAAYAAAQPQVTPRW